MSTTHRVAAGSVGVLITIYVTQDGTPVPLTGAAVQLMWRRPNHALFVVSAEVTDPDGGVAQYTTTSGQLDQEGKYTVTPTVIFTSPERRFPGTDIIIDAY